MCTHFPHSHTKKGCNNSLCVHIWNTHKGVTNMEIILMTVHSRVSHDAIPAGLSSKSLYHDCIEDCYVNVPYIHVPLCVWSCPKPYRKSWKRSHVTSSPTWRKGTYIYMWNSNFALTSAVFFTAMEYSSYALVDCMAYFRALTLAHIH